MISPTRLGMLATVMLCALASVPVRAQQTSQGPTPYPPAKVDVVLERYQGDKKVASMPFSVWVTGGAQGRSPSSGSVRIGVDVPIGSTTETRGSNQPNGQGRSATTTAPQYRTVGTSIDCYLKGADDGKYSLEVRLDDSSIFEPVTLRDAGASGRGPAGTPSRSADSSAFRTFSFDSTLPMRDGQTAEFVNATDKITGEVVKAIVTLTIAK